MAKSGFDVFMEKRNAKKTLYKIEDEINLLANLVSNQEFDDRFDSAVVSFQMFLEKIKDDSLKKLVKELRSIQFGPDIYLGHNGQETYVKKLKREFNQFFEEYEKQNLSVADKLKQGTEKLGKQTNPFLKDLKQKE